MKNVAARIGLVAYGLDRPLTGIGRHTVELLRALEELGTELRCVVLTTGKPLYIPNDIQSDRYSISPSGRLPMVLLSGGRKIQRVSRDLGLQLVHDPTGIAPFALENRQFCSIITVHDTYPYRFPASSTLLENLIARIWLPIALSRMDKIITVSRNSKADIIRHLHQPDDKICVIPNGVGDRFRKLGKQDIIPVLEKYGLKPGYLFTVSSFNPRRNLKRLLGAYRLLSAKDSLPPLVVVGKKRQGETAEINSNAFADRVFWLGQVPDEDLPALYNGAGLFIFPSLYEGFGLPSLEAFACGVPVASSQAASLKEVAGDAAILFDPLDVSAIAASIACLLHDPGLCEQLIDRGFRRVREFSWLRTAEMTLDVYRSVLENADVA